MIARRVLRLPGVDGELVALLGWNAVPGLGPLRLKRILKAAGSARVAAQDPARWHSAAGRGTPRLPSAAELRDLGEVQREAAERHGATALGWGLPDYPARMVAAGEAECFLPAPVLYRVGAAEALDPAECSIAVVGARACTPYGRRQARRFGTVFADAGWTVVSGAARGIDQAAMRGAVEAGGRVLAVLGSPLDRIYPQDANELLREILEAGGAVVSEFPFGSGTRPGNFPRRNRLLAAAGDALLVVQASVHSGTMSTCTHALELGREVYALPGDVDCPVSAGCHELIRNGCGLALSPMQVMDEFLQRSSPVERGLEDPLLVALREGPLRLESLAAACDSSTSAAQQRLVDLELRGLVSRGPGGTYRRSGPSRDD